MTNYFNYFTEIEEYFVRKRGKNLLVAPLDWCLIELWKQNGIPLHVVLRGIDRSFESTQSKNKKPPRTLFYCHPAVLEAFEEHRQAMAGASNEGLQPAQETLSRDSVIAYLEKLESALGVQEGEVFSRASERLKQLKAEISARHTNDYEQVDCDLAQIGLLVLESLKQRLRAEKLREIALEVAKETKIYKKRLSKEMFSRLEQNYIDRKIRELYGLPEFSLFALS